MGSTAKGVANGLATLDSSAKIPAAQLPSLAGTYAVAPLVATATLNFASTLNGATSAELTVTVTGAAAGDKVVIGAPATLEAGLIPFGYVSAANTVSIRVANVSGGTVDPASASWKVAVFTT